ncbi:MAG: precorrin-2 C(20)-methyltransferase [Lachnospiraceae bacterium]
MTGKLYGIGVGPGDPELLTIKAVRLIKECDVIAVPGKQKEETVAYKIVEQAVPKVAQKECLCIDMPMTKEEQQLEKSHSKAAQIIETVLKQGKNVAFLTLGDPCIYSTYIYVHKRIEAAGYETEIVSGIPSFCAVAARLNQGLVEKSQMLHIIPSSYDIETGLEFPGTKVLMKAGRKMEIVKEQLKKRNEQAVMVENCGMIGEQIYQDVEHIPKQAGYYSLIIVKEQL